MQNDLKTVLHIDDDALLRASLGAVLRTSGYTVFSADGGRSGIDSAKLNHPAVIVVDYEMPDIDGIAVVKEVRAEGEWGLHVPIIFATNKYDLTAMNELMRYGVTDYIIKSDVGIAGIERIISKYV